MAAAPRRRTTPSTATRRSTVTAREELQRTLARDTAVQGEREEEAAAATPAPAGSDTSPPAGRPAPDGRQKKTP